MSLIYNGVEVEKIIYNGNEVESLIYNGVEAWSAAKGPLGLRLAAEGGGYGTWEYVTPDMLKQFDPVLNNNSWEQISLAARWGIADLLWNVGDVKMIELNGRIGDFFTADHLELGVFILDFNHADNGVADNNIIFGGFKTAISDGKDVALCDSRYGSGGYADGGKCFNMNHWGQYNYGGWKGSDLRYDILGATSTAPSGYGTAKQTSCVGYDATAATLTSPKADTFLAALPSDFRSVMRLWTRWVDAVGNASKVDANIKATVDAVTLLAEPEIFASVSYANQYEKNHNTRMAYYTAGNGTIKKNHSKTSFETFWWECSPFRTNATHFCDVSAGGAAHGLTADGVYGLAPAFKI